MIILKYILKNMRA